jgi:hypothetical protein
MLQGTRPHQRRHLGMGETGIGAVDQRAQIRARDLVADERRQDFKRQILKRQAGPGAQGRGVELGNLGRHQETAIGGEPHHDRIRKADGGDAAPGAQIMHAVL